jgi:hypothetical protein
MASKKFIERNIENDKALFPEKSDFDRLISPKALDEKTIAIRAESFEKFKEGK